VKMLHFGVCLQKNVKNNSYIHINCFRSSLFNVETFDMDTVNMIFKGMLRNRH
jgi:hypothetical protein